MTTTETSQRLRICLERDSLLLIKEEILRYRSEGFFAIAQKDASLSPGKRFCAIAQRDASLSLREILRYRSERRFAIDQEEILRYRSETRNSLTFETAFYC